MHRPLTLVSLVFLLACDSGPKAPAEPAPTAPGAPARPVQGEGAPPSADPAAAPPAPNPLADPAAVAAVGQPAPDFTLPGADGKTYKLSDFKGKRVVLEWFNPECPFVKAAHETGPLKDLAGKTTATGVTWLAINSGAPGRQGHGAELNAAAANNWNLAHPVLLDETGAVGKAYGATNTPHMYLIDDRGVLVYRGALDNAPMGTPDPAGPRLAYLEDALAALAAGKALAQGETRAWGCSVKFAK
jgi:peroxiredoxin